MKRASRVIAGLPAVHTLAFSSEAHISYILQFSSASYRREGDGPTPTPNIYLCYMWMPPQSLAMSSLKSRDIKFDTNTNWEHDGNPLAWHLYLAFQAYYSSETERNNLSY